MAEFFLKILSPPASGGSDVKVGLSNKKKDNSDVDKKFAVHCAIKI